MDHKNTVQLHAHRVHLHGSNLRLHEERGLIGYGCAPVSNRTVRTETVRTLVVRLAADDALAGVVVPSQPSPRPTRPAWKSSFAARPGRGRCGQAVPTPPASYNEGAAGPPQAAPGLL